jgi:hypothetical protein
MRRGRALAQLTALLKGQSPTRVHWLDVLRLSNRAFVTPRLERCLPAAAPAEVCVFVQEVALRNRHRNDRLFRQMAAAATALNAVGIVPSVIKGGATLARASGLCSHIISDIDLVVPPDRISAALGALQNAGFELFERHSGASQHVAAVLGRSGDVGHIDLHQRPPGPRSDTAAPRLLVGETRQVGGASVSIPLPHLQIYLIALHDQMHDGGYWRGGFDVRHAWDIGDLIASGEGVDWKALALLPPTTLSARVLQAQLIACHYLTGASVPSSMLGQRAEFHFRRQYLQFAVPTLRFPLAAMALTLESVPLVEHRQREHRADTMAGSPPQPTSLCGSLAKLYRDMTTDNCGRL